MIYDLASKTVIMKVDRTVNQLYSETQDVFDDLDLFDVDVPFRAVGPTHIILESGWLLDSHSLPLIHDGRIEDTDGNVWTSVKTRTAGNKWKSFGLRKEDPV